MPFYLHRWQEVEADLGVTADFYRVRWYRVIGGPWEGPSGTVVRGMWVDDHRIYLADDHLTDPPVLKHEMLHDILGEASHGHPLFSTREYKRSPYR